MNVFETLRLALINLALHKFRAFLAAMGIILGVASVEVMVSIIEGAKEESLNRFMTLGLDNILLQSAKPSKADAAKSSGSARGAYYSAAEYGLLRKDLAHIRGFPEIRYAVGARDMRSSLFSSHGRELDLQVMATEPDYLSITRSGVQRGRFLTDTDGADHKRVCVLGEDAARKLFGFRDPLDGSVRIGTHWYNVVGVLENRASLKAAGGEDINNYVFIPLATARALNGDLSVRYGTGSAEAVRVQLDAIEIQMADTAAVVPTAERLKTYLEKTHKQKDYQLVVPYELMKQKEAEARTYAIVMGSIAGISLVVGGIGIMNIMLANVYDRRKEIGTRRALGARRRDILYQFLFEAGTLTTLGGAFGATMGYALGGYHYSWWKGQTLITYITGGWPAIFTPWSAPLGMGVSCFVGIVFGLWPAYQAAKVNPIEALRSE